MRKYLHVGGLVAAGFDPTGKFLLTVSASGRGVLSVGSWEKVARDTKLAYPENGRAIGIGPIDGISIPIEEMDYETEELRFESPDGRYRFSYDSGAITIDCNDG